MRIAVLDRDHCQPEKCSPSEHKPCIKWCPRVRSGDETIVLDETGNPHIYPNLCSGCGICIKKCPFYAIKIENVPERLDNDLTHQFGPDGFALFRFPTPRTSRILGLIGQNGTGKSTAMKILAGELQMNLGRFGDEAPSWEEIIQYFRGSELQSYFERLSNKEISLIHKPQNITDLPKIVKGKVSELLGKIDQTNQLANIIPALNLEKIYERDLKVLSGGELQRVAIAAAVLRDGDVYLFDEPSSYLDIKERLNMARLIRSLGERDKTIIVIEHDLAVLDYLSDHVCLLYGAPGAYGIVSHPQGVRVGINIYLNGYIKDENMRIREFPIRFHDRPPIEAGFEQGSVILTFEDLEKTLGNFHLTVSGGEIHAGEVIGIVGPNGIGKSTFINMLAGIVPPDSGTVTLEHAGDRKIKVAFKPQYIKPDEFTTVGEALDESIRKGAVESGYRKRIERELVLEPLMERKLSELSGGELQRVEIAKCLSSDSDIYLLDEPSAFLDVEMRLTVARLIRRSIESYKKSAFVVEHDIITQDFIADSLLVFDGTPGISGEASQILDLRSGMNEFLKTMNVTFRRDAHTGRPRVNKQGSKKDKYQKEVGEYYYVKTG